MHQACIINQLIEVDFWFKINFRLVFLIRNNVNYYYDHYKLYL